MDVDPFHLAGNLSRFVAGRRPADITWVINQRAIRGGLHRIVVDVEFAAVHDNDHQPFHAGQNSKRAASSICRATSVETTAGRNWANNRSDSGGYRVDFAATPVIHPAGAHYATAAVDDSALQASPGEQAAIALAALSQPAVEPLIAALNNGNPSVRRNAAWAIGEIRGGLRTNRTAAVEPLIATLSDEDSSVRVAAAFSLGEMRPSEATESLIAALGDAEWNVRWMAAWALGEMKARAAVESLTSTSLRDENKWVRRKAVWALGEIRDSQERMRNLKFAGRLTSATRTFEWNLTDPQGSKMARLKINGQIKSGSSIWALLDPNGKSAFTAESDKAELSLDSGDLNVIPGKWTLQVEFKNATLDFEVLWSVR